MKAPSETALEQARARVVVTCAWNTHDGDDRDQMNQRALDWKALKESRGQTFRRENIRELAPPAPVNKQRGHAA